MKPVGFHLIFRVEGDRNIASTATARRRLACAVLAAARPFPLLAFRWADTHGHATTAGDGDRGEAGECARRIEIAVSRSLGLDVAFVPARIKPILDAPHLRNTFLYVLGQEARHGVTLDPTFDASNVPDLLGARVTGAWTVSNVRTALPRIRKSDILTATGLRDPDRGPLPLDLLADAAAAAVGRSALEGRESCVVAARRAAAHLARAEGPTALAAALGLSAAGIRNLLRQPPDASLVRAVARQLGLRGPSADPSISAELP